MLCLLQVAKSTQVTISGFDKCAVGEQRCSGAKCCGMHLQVLHSQQSAASLLSFCGLMPPGLHSAKPPLALVV